MSEKPLEIELKIELAPSSVNRLLRASWLGSATGPAKLLHSVYYDTPTRDLNRARAALRLRRVGRHWVQTLKVDGGVQGGLHRRIELEHPVAQGQIDLTRLPADPLFDFIRATPVRSQLGVLFETRFTRQTWIIEPGAGIQVELALDRGRVSAAGQVHPLCEVELEIKQGDPAILFDLARRILDLCGGRLGNVSKAERGFRLLDGLAETGPVAFRPPAYPADVSARTACLHAIQACQEHFEANLAACLEAGSDPDAGYLHQLRSALRRLRSALGLIRRLEDDVVPDALAQAIKTLASALDDARNWDVLETGVLPTVDLQRCPHGVDALRSRISRLRAAAHRNARQALDEVATQRMLLDLTAWQWQWASTPDRLPSAAEFAAAAWSRRDREVRKRARGHEHAHDEQWHALRIAVKKLRHVSDFFAPVLPDAGRRQPVLLELQNALGHFNDLSSSLRLLDQGFGAATSRQENIAASYLRGWLEHDRLSVLAHAEQSLARVLRLR